ncbi:MAG: HAD hydrolase-like protein [Gammaproteobacteria bacterium]
MAIIKGRWPRAVFYDSKTTLFNWGWSWAEAAGRINKKYGSPVDDTDFIGTWVRFFESHHRRTAFSQYTPVTETIREALMDTFNSYGIEGSSEDVSFYTELQKDVELFQDTEEALQNQQDMGVKVFIYSDVESEFLDMYVSKFRTFKPDFVGSTEQPRIHKPNPLTYDWVLQQNGMQARDVLYCAAPAFDVQGAMSAGLIAAWLRRPVDGMLANQAPSEKGLPADYEIESLHDITRILEANRGQ